MDRENNVVVATQMQLRVATKRIYRGRGVIGVTV